MTDARLPLAKLHLHMYGTIRAEDYLERLGARDVDWRFYETMFERAYGERPPCATSWSGTAPAIRTRVTRSGACSCSATRMRATSSASRPS